MHSVRLVFLLHSFLYLVQQQHLADCKGCNYSMLEEALVGDPDNLEQLQLAFFPTNKQKRIVFDVVYHIFRPDIESNVNSSQLRVVSEERGDQRGIDIAHRILRNADGDGNDDIEKADNSLKFRWMTSPVIMFCRPELLKNLSLLAFETDITTINLTINACDYYQKGEENVCREPELDQADIRRLLNELTTNLYSYALHQQSSSHFGIQNQDEKGYSAFFYNSSLPNSYCVINNEESYAELRKYSSIALGLLVLFIMLIVPTIFVAIYEKLYENMKDSKRLQYFVWAIASITFILSLVIVGFDIAVWHFNKENYLKAPEENRRIFFSFLCFIAVPFLDLIAVIIGLCVLKCCSKKWKEDFPIPSLIQCVSCIYFCCCPCSTIICKNLILIGIGITSFMIFLQFSSFHISSMVLAAVVLPVETLSHIIFYLASFFFFTAIVAFILKFTDKSGCDELCNNCGKCNSGGDTNDTGSHGNRGGDDAGNHENRGGDTDTGSHEDRGGDTDDKGGDTDTGSHEDRGGDTDDKGGNAGKMELCKEFLRNAAKFLCNVAKFLCNAAKFCPIFLSILILAVSGILFGIFFFLSSTMIEKYHNNGGILAFVGVLIPSTLTVLIGLCKTSLMGCIDVTKKDNQERVEAQAQNA